MVVFLDWLFIISGCCESVDCNYIVICSISKYGEFGEYFFDFFW